MSNQSTTAAKREPVDQFQELRYNLFQSASWLNNGTRQFLQPFGITPKQFSIMGILAHQSPQSMSIQEVRDSLADKMSDASRLIDRLDKKGLLEKFPSDFDRRSNRVRITDKGTRLLARIGDEQARLNQLISDRLGEREIS
ncbi:MAG: MarR family transcriptional regulator, partial [Bacteroidota bacterium]